MNTVQKAVLLHKNPRHTTKAMTFSLLLLLFSSGVCLGQEEKTDEKKHILTISPAGLVNKLRLKYEYQLKDKVSTGTFFSFRYANTSGFSIDPFVRYYFGAEAPEGLYLQGKLLFSSYTREFDYYEEEGDWTTGYLFTKEQSFFNFGLGFGLGYQWVTGKKDNVVADVAIGIKIQTLPASVSEVTINGQTGYLATVDWYTTGPGSIFDGLLAVGIAF